MKPPLRQRTRLFLVILAVGLAAPSDGAIAAKAYRRIPAIPGAPPPATLSEFIARLRTAVEARDRAPILASVSDRFQCLRDFGGVCNGRMTPREKLSAITGLASGAAGEPMTAGFAVLARLLKAGHYALTTAHGATKKPLLCGPSVPKFDEKIIAKIDRELFGGDGQSFRFEWLAIPGERVAVHGKPSPAAAVVDTLSLEVVHADVTVAGTDGWFAVDLPSGAKFHVRDSDVVPLLPEQLCFTKHPSRGWRISAFVGGGD
jgi:hypothetical protein